MANSLTSFSLAGRVALVTGGAGHLGQPICRGLAEAGAEVWINGRDPVKTEAFAAELRGLGRGAQALAFNVTDHARAAECIAGLARLDILVNNAAPIGLRIRLGGNRRIGVRADHGCVAAAASSGRVGDQHRIDVRNGQS